ncbi:hypothetical protein SPI_03656 [Niveomyces insectorum RCEF 264]|uniref:AB hydrolase-1 domain-containing protein n=1 Tax=Niveomyces insectorum RCEF 264 TaxID=1081102 RepID=A0A167W972_9HYPO|nr:hypothetical protein SPI_03656 [Niveomyces insectorum RCEF 264]
MWSNTAAASAASAGPAKRTWLMGTEAFEGRMPHHDGIKALWETKLKFPCTQSVYPFHDGRYEDFGPIFEHLIAHGINDGTAAAYTEAFFPTAEALISQADARLAAGDKAAASALYLRACAVYRIARFPYISAAPVVNDAVKWRAWTAQKTAYLRAAATWNDPVEEVLVPHVHRRTDEAAAAGSFVEGDTIPVYVRLPKAAARAHGTAVPVLLLLTGLDGYRPDNTGRLDEFLARGWASVVAEIPGTADCPADPADPASPDRLWDSLLAWMAAYRSGGTALDMRRVVVWGLSAGGYYAVRIAHTHAARLAGVVAQGAGVHYFFDPAWLARADGHEYPFQLTPALAAKHGYATVAAYVAGAQAKFSLLLAGADTTADTNGDANGDVNGDAKTNANAHANGGGLLDRPSAPLLLVNGTQDGLMPIEDSLLLLEHGSPKTARFFPGRLHMGYPVSNASVYPWIEGAMAAVKD